jgi:hypothetical protein
VVVACKGQYSTLLITCYAANNFTPAHVWVCQQFASNRYPFAHTINEAAIMLQGISRVSAGYHVQSGATFQLL